MEISTNRTESSIDLIFLKKLNLTKTKFLQENRTKEKMAIFLEKKIDSPNKLIISNFPFISHKISSSKYKWYKKCVHALLLSIICP